MSLDEQAEFLEHMRSGMRRGAAAEAMGYTRLDVIAFIRPHPDFESAVIDAEELATEHVEEALYQAAVSGSVPAAKLWLERARPQRRYVAPAPEEVAAGTESVYEDELEAIMRLTTD
jgi:hypothetical protein